MPFTSISVFIEFLWSVFYHSQCNSCSVFIFFLSVICRYIPFVTHSGTRVLLFSCFRFTLVFLSFVYIECMAFSISVRSHVHNTMNMLIIKFHSISFSWLIITIYILLHTGGVSEQFTKNHNVTKSTLYIFFWVFVYFPFDSVLKCK